MYTFMIADDEKAIRENIPKVIDFVKYGFSLCGTAGDGEEALRKTKELHPNLVLLDIKMPGLDGLSYLKQLKECELEDIKVIILSGYCNFYYAQTALRYGARGYFTKPLDEDELTNFLVEIKEELDECDRDNKKKYMRSIANELRKMYHDGNGDRSIYMEFCFLHFVVLSKEQNNEVFSQINAKLCDFFYGEVELFLYKGSVYSFLCKKSAVTIQGCLNETAISHIINQLQKCGIECTVLVDIELFEDEDNTFRSDFDSHLYTMLTDVYWKTKEKVILYAKGREEQETDSWQYIKKHVMNLKTAVSQENESDALKCMEAIFREAESRHVDFISLVEIYYRVFYTLRELVIDDQELERRFKAMRWQDSTYFVTHNEMAEYCKERVKAMIEYKAMVMKKQNPGVGAKAIEYIQNNFHKQIMLKDVADALYVNSAYLGRCIQKETGLSFNSYLAMLRMRKAKELLINTDMMVYEIAESVGYMESKHFVTKFTSMEGCAPLSYRKKVFEER